MHQIRRVSVPLWNRELTEPCLPFAEQFHVLAPNQGHPGNRRRLLPVPDFDLAQQPRVRGSRTSGQEAAVHLRQLHQVGRGVRRRR